MCSITRIIRTKITLRNASRPDLASIEVSALVDTGAMLLCIPESLRLQLALETAESREVTTADGTRHLVPYVGPVRVTFGNRNCMTGAMVIGDEPLLGAVPMEDLDIVINPSRLEVIPNPASPNIPAAIAKGLRPKTSRGLTQQRASS